MRSEQTRERDSRSIFLSAVLYAALVMVPLRVLPFKDGAVALWPAIGLFVATLLLFPRRRRTVLGLFFLSYLLVGFAGTTPGLPHTLYSVLVVFEAWAAAALIESSSPMPFSGETLADVFRLFLAGSVLASGAAGLVAAGISVWQFGDTFSHAWTSWWFPDAAGIFIITPLVVGIARRRSDATPSAAWLAETALIAAAALAASVHILLTASPRVPITVVVLPVLVWSALRRGVLGLSVVALMLWTSAALATAGGRGAFLSLAHTYAGQLAWTHAYIVVSVGSVLALAAVMAERALLARQFERSVAELRDAYARAQSLIASAPDMLGAIDNEFRIIAFNPAWALEFRNLAEVEPSIGLRLDLLLQARGTNWALTALGGWVRALAGESFAARRGADVIGSAREMSVEFTPIRDTAGRIIGAVQLLRDVTNERRRQQAEAQARRDESVGQLAGGIAHDFNNIITGIVAYAALLDQSLAAGDERRQDVAEIERAAGRAAELTSQLLAYARRQEVAPRDVEPNAVIRGAEQLLRRLIGAELELVVSLSPLAWHVRVDPAQLERVLVNLSINARDAMPEGGRLRIASTNVTMQAADLPQPASGTGDYVRIDISDTGHGIPPELFENIFEPFFTTKAVGKGTGLGLASVFGVLQQSGGAIGVESTVGSGTTFSVYLPRASEPLSGS